MPQPGLLPSQLSHLTDNLAGLRHSIRSSVFSRGQTSLTQHGVLWLMTKWPCLEKLSLGLPSSPTATRPAWHRLAGRKRTSRARGRTSCHWSRDCSFPVQSETDKGQSQLGWVCLLIHFLTRGQWAQPQECCMGGRKGCVLLRGAHSRRENAKAAGHEWPLDPVFLQMSSFMRPWANELLGQHSNRS